MDSNYDVQNIYKIVNGSIIKGTATKEKNNVYSRWEDSKYVIVGSAPSVSPKKEIYFSYEDAKRARRKIIKKEIPAFLIEVFFITAFAWAITKMIWLGVLIGVLGGIGLTVFEIKHKDSKLSDAWELRNYPEYPDYPDIGDSGGC